jgi:hypothetical protein
MRASTTADEACHQTVLMISYTDILITFPVFPDKFSDNALNRPLPPIFLPIHQLQSPISLFHFVLR